MQNHIWTQGKLKAIQFSHFPWQGPIVDLPKSLSRLVNRRVHFRARGTGLIWLDYDQKKSNTIKVRSIARRKLLLQDTSPPFFCASCKGSLHAADICLPAYLAHCMHICWCNAACHHQGSSHIRKRCGTCLRRFGPQRDLFLCTRESIIRCFILRVLVCFSLDLCIAVMERHSAPRLLQFM